MANFAETFRQLQSRPMCLCFHHVTPPYVGSALSKLVHLPDFVDSFVHGTIEHKRWRPVGLPWSHLLVQRTLWEVSGSVLAAELALLSPLKCSLSTAGGAHHAKHASGGGFCIQSDHVIAIASLIERGLIHNALIFDADVHQGDGTASVVNANREDYPGIYTCSVHCQDNFPIKVESSDLDWPLPSGTGDTEFLKACASALKHAVAQSQPLNLIVYISGVDPFHEDPLGKLSVSRDALWQRDLLVFDYARALDIPICGLVGGGYAHKGIEELSQRHCLMHEAAAKVFCA